jgi:hypothetical protein
VAFVLGLTIPADHRLLIPAITKMVSLNKKSPAKSSPKRELHVREMAKSILRSRSIPQRLSNSTSAGQRLRKKRQAIVHPIIDAGMVVGKLFV